MKDQEFSDEDYTAVQRSPDDPFDQLPDEGEEFLFCSICQKPVLDCDCTGGPQTEIECTCYEPEYGHQMGCSYYGKR